MVNVSGGVLVTSALTDVTADVEAVFDEMECCIDPDKNGPHDGDTAAFYECHSCKEGFICRGHLDLYVRERLPMQGRSAFIRCIQCGELFYRQDFDKVYPL